MNCIPLRRYYYQLLIMIALLVCTGQLMAQDLKFQTQYAKFSINKAGFFTSIKSRSTGKEYCPKGISSAVMSLEIEKKYILPNKIKYNSRSGQLIISYPNGSEAIVIVQQETTYLKFTLLSLSKREAIDNIVWGPYKTNISKTIGDIMSVVRSEDFAIGMLGLNDNTTAGPPSDGDMSFMYYYIHSPDPKKYPLPSNLKEGQTFSIGGDGVSDVAFYSQPEEYYRMNYGNGAQLEPAFGSSICMHSRDRRKEQMIRFPYYPEGLDGKANSSRYQLVTATNADLQGSAIALYACPDSLGLNTIEKIVLKEKLPHPTIDGKWIKDPAAYRPDIAWWGSHDSLASYCKQLGIYSVQDEGWGEYYPNPANRWTKKGINFSGRKPMTIPEYGKFLQQEGIRYGLHTLCEFLQPYNSDVSPVPSDSLAIMQRTKITKDISPEDTIITVADSAYFNEFGGWEGNHTNVLKIGKELIEYDGITRSTHYTFLKVKRGFHNTVRGSYKTGTTIVKLQPNCYHGFAPDMNLQEVYADYYGKWLNDGGMDYIDFDGLESCMYQGHGQYSYKRFFRSLFDSYYRNGGKYLRVMGSAIQEGSWHYMSVCNVGGGDHMFSPVLNKWGIEGKDIRYVWESSYFPATFGIQTLASDWTVYDAENLQAKSIGWNATYMLGLSQQSTEINASKKEIFTAIRAWENARKAEVFTKAHKEMLADLTSKFHLEQKGEKSFLLYPVKENRFVAQSLTTQTTSLKLQNDYEEQQLDLAIKINVQRDSIVKGLKIKLANNKEIIINKRFTAGQYIIYKNGILYLADKGRNKMEEIEIAEPLVLAKGPSEISITALVDPNEKTSFDLVVTSIGKPKKI